MKSCTIYKTINNEYKIVSQRETTAGYLLDIIPVYILSVNCSGEDLLSAILKALDNSSKIIKAPDRTEFPVIQKRILSDLKEKSFSKLYMTSSSCSLRVESNIMNIYPNSLMTEGQPKDGLVWVKEGKVTIERYTSNLEKIYFCILEILNRKY